MLSVLLVDHKKLKHQKNLCFQGLRGEDHEIISADTWDEGFKKAKGEYVCLLEPKSQLGDNYFHELLDVFLEQPSFRKLAFVAPSVSKIGWFDSKRVYGYKIDNTGVIPNLFKSSILPYSIQIGFLPGAIIRRSVLQDLEGFEDDLVMNSVRLSLHFWNGGLRCLIDPRAIYLTPELQLDTPIIIKDQLPKDIGKLVAMFKREIIG